MQELELVDPIDSGLYFDLQNNFCLRFDQPTEATLKEGQRLLSQVHSDGTETSPVAAEMVLRLDCVLILLAAVNCSRKFNAKM